MMALIVAGCVAAYLSGCVVACAVFADSDGELQDDSFGAILAWPLLLVVSAAFVVIAGPLYLVEQAGKRLRLAFERRKAAKRLPRAEVRE